MLNWFKINKLTNRELGFALFALFFFALFIGQIYAQGGSAIENWDAISALGSVIGAVIALVAVVLAVIGYQQTRQSHKEEFRPNIRIEFRKLHIQPNELFGLTIVPINYGRTAALNVTIRAAVHFKPALTYEPIDRNVSSPSSSFGNSLVLHPEDKHEINASSLHNITEAELAAMKVVGVGRTEARFRLHIAYNDKFNEQHETFMAWVISASSEGYTLGLIDSTST